MDKEKWKKLQDFQESNKDLLIMIACPKDDAISISFGGLGGFVKFPGKDMKDGVVFNALRESKFEDAIDPFMSGIIEASGIKESGSGGELLKTLGGGMMSIGKQREIIKKDLMKPKTHGKTKSKNR